MAQDEVDLDRLTLDETLIACAAVKCLRLWNRVSSQDGGKLSEHGGRCSTICKLLDEALKVSIGKDFGAVFVETNETQGA